MSMPLTTILDIAYGVLLLICILVGVFKGWTKTLFGLVLLFVAGLLANICTPIFVGYVKGFTIPGTNETAFNFVSTRATDFLKSSIEMTKEPIDAKLVTEHNIKAIICGTLNIPSAFWPNIWKLVQPNLAAATSDGKVDLALTLGMTAADGSCQLITWLICYFVIYIVGSIIISIILHIVKKIREKRSPDGKAHRPAWSRLLGVLFGALIAASMIIGVNSTAHVFTTIDPEGKIYPLEASLGIENGKQVTPSASGWIYLMTGKITDLFFPANTESTTKEENLNHLVITLDKNDSTVTIPAMGGSIDQSALPEGVSDYITVNDNGDLVVELPTTKDEYDHLVETIASSNSVSEEQVEAYLAAAGIEVAVDEDSNVTYNIEVPTDPTEIEEWLNNLKDISSGSGEGEGE